MSIPGCKAFALQCRAQHFQGNVLAVLNVTDLKNCFKLNYAQAFFAHKVIQDLLITESEPVRICEKKVQGTVNFIISFAVMFTEAYLIHSNTFKRYGNQ